MTYGGGREVAQGEGLRLWPAYLMMGSNCVSSTAGSTDQRSSGAINWAISRHLSDQFWAKTERDGTVWVGAWSRPVHLRGPRVHPHLRQIWLPLTPTIKACRAWIVSIRLKASPWQCEKEGGCRRGGWVLRMTERNTRRGGRSGFGGQECPRHQREGGGFSTRTQS